MVLSPTNKASDISSNRSRSFVFCRFNGSPLVNELRKYLTSSFLQHVPTYFHHAAKRSRWMPQSRVHLLMREYFPHPHLTGSLLTLPHFDQKTDAFVIRATQLEVAFPVLGIVPTLPSPSRGSSSRRLEAPVCFPHRFGLVLQASTPFEVERIKQKKQRPEENLTPLS